MGSTFSPSDAPALDSSNRCLGLGISIRDEGSKMMDQGLWIGEQGYGIRNSGSVIRDQ